MPTEDGVRSDEEAAADGTEAPVYDLWCRSCAFTREVAGRDRVFEVAAEHDSIGGEHFVEFELRDAEEDGAADE